MPTSRGIPYLTADQMAEVDRRMVRDYHIELAQMMELAGRNLADLARLTLDETVAGRRIAVLCGSGNNGGGGMVAARHLHNWGAEVHAVLVGDAAHLKPAPRRRWGALERLGIAAQSRSKPTVDPQDLILDAIFGYGFHGRPRPRAARWIEWANAQRTPILALDLPSGLDATTGVPSTPCIRATATVSLALPKTGLRSPQAADHVGRLYLADIGVPPEIYQHLGYDVGPLFADGPILQLEASVGDDREERDG